MNIERIPLERIDVGERLRAIDEDYASVIAASMDEHGQMTPIEVRAWPKAGGYLLVAGAHRYRALQIAGTETAMCQVFTGSELQAALREVDENLIRHELNELDRASFLTRRKEIYEQLHPETRAGNNWSEQRGQFGHAAVPRFSAEAAEKVRLSERTIRRAVALHGRLLPDVRQTLAGTWMATSGVQLEALSRLSPELQRATADCISRYPALRTVRELVAVASGAPAVSPVVADFLDQQFEAFTRLWRRMRAPVRARVRAFLEEEKG